MGIGNERNRKMSKKKCVIGIILAMIFSFGISMSALIYSIVTIAVAFYLMREKKLQPVLQG